MASFLLAACVAPGPAAPDAELDAAPDAEPDADPYSPPDAQLDAQLDAPPDASPDASPDATCEAPLAPVLPPADDGFLLGLAGVPQGSFGPETAPDFAKPLADLVVDGFNRFVPVFLTSESGEGSSEILFFLPPEVTGAPVASSCAGPTNPWLEAPPGMGIILPAFLLVLDVPANEPLNADLVADRVSAFVDTCLAGDPSRLAAAYLQDEPATSYAGSRADADAANDYLLANVAALAQGTRAKIAAPLLVVEAPLPRGLPYLGFSTALEAQLLADWEVGVAATAPLADLYGFDFYAVDLTDDLSVLAGIVDDAQALAPDSSPLAVIQGFGYADMEMTRPPATGRRPTPQEVRASAFVPVARGAEGLFWYGQSALAIDDPDPTLWNAIRAAARDLRRLSGVLALPRLALDLGNPAVEVRAHADTGSAWILAVNPTAEVQRIHLAPGLRLQDALTGEPVNLPGEERDLAPYEVITWWRAGCP